jgi:hypothetical protein
MKLTNATLRPGIVRAVEKGNQIKVSAPGLFSAEDPPEKLPPVKLFSSPSANAVTSVKELDEVWVLSFSDNPAELYWMRKDDSLDAEDAKEELDKTNDESQKMGEHPEIIFNQNDEGSRGAIYFSKESGLVIKKDDSCIHLKGNGDIVIDGGFPGSRIEISKTNITIGGMKASPAQPAVLGDNLQDVIDLITESLAAIQGAAQKSPYTMQIALALAPRVAKLQNESSAICSQNVKIG